MVFLSSLSLWSSIKIPLPTYGKKRTSPPVPYVDSCKDFLRRNYNIKEAAPAREMVNLRVPVPLGEKEENPNESPHHSFGAMSVNHKMRTRSRFPSKPKTKQISYVTVPGGAFFNKSNCKGETFTNNYAETILNSRRSIATRSNDKYPKFNFEKVCSSRGQYGGIPSVKPWTREELDEVKRKYDFLESKILKLAAEGKAKNKRRGNILTHYTTVETPSGSSNEKKLTTFLLPPSFTNPDVEEYECEGNHSSDDLSSDQDCLKSDYLKGKLTARTKAKLTGAAYYEEKLAELYKITLGFAN